ncbi:putative saposin [Lupinus albus]|uniref:Putative saposin n=1 Tax=Lupinus albus TaxID=3870 RepID=A0A6A4PNJ5_LUPAL|nr:putative saposin [Lupinus albus]
MMAGRLRGLLFLIVLGAAWSCDARYLGIANSDTAISVQNGKSDVCALCEEYAAEALDYLNDENNQKEIIGTLHNTCYQMLSFKKQCTELVDYYVSLFFSQVASVQPRELCKKLILCPNSANTSSQVQESSCGFCRDAVSALVVKLKDPDTELQIMQELLKMCNSMENLTKNCKRMVLEYGPLIFVNADKFLKTEEICTALHACPAATEVSREEAPLVSDS